jgi:hypothetical protein
MVLGSWFLVLSFAGRRGRGLLLGGDDELMGDYQVDALPGGLRHSAIVLFCFVLFCFVYNQEPRTKNLASALR